MNEYPYQLEQDVVDRYLELPAADRPPFEQWVPLQWEADMTVFLAEWKPFAEAFEATVASLSVALTVWIDPFLPFYREYALRQAMEANARAAARRRTWRVKPSMVRY
jgi:hypothetical protein